MTASSSERLNAVVSTRVGTATTALYLRPSSPGLSATATAYPPPPTPAQGVDDVPHSARRDDGVAKAPDNVRSVVST